MKLIMGSNFCTAEDSTIDKYEKDFTSNIYLSNTNSVFNNNFEVPNPNTLAIRRFELKKLCSNIKHKIPDWGADVTSIVKIVETPGKEFEDIVTSRMGTLGNTEVVLDGVETLVRDTQTSKEFKSRDNGKFLKERLEVKHIKGNLYEVNGIANVLIKGHLSILCNVDFEDMFSDELRGEIQKLNYQKEPYKLIKEKLFHKNFLLRLLNNLD